MLLILTSVVNTLLKQGLSNVSYDLNGNIIRLKRYNESAQLIDNLVYNYGGTNQLQQVADNSQNTEGYNVASSQFMYDDKNGNMTQDIGHGLTIGYNFLNLPKTVTKSGVTSNYIYTAGGTKLAFEDNANHKKTTYCGGFVYENTGSGDKLSYILTGEGRILHNEGAFKREYFLKDHLGNTRVAFNEDGNATQETDYYPFGMQHVNSSLASDQNQKYLYNGKEIQEVTDWYDYGARFYDASLGRFMVQDAFAEKYYPMSPYQYAANNPTNLIDVNGDSISVNVIQGGGKNGRDLYQIP